MRSPFGAVLRGIRENEAKTVALGYNTRRYKIAIVAISFGLAGLAGALYAPFAGFANTELLFWLLSGQVLIMVIVGGAGTLIGPILGAIFFLYVQQQLSSYTDSWALFFGVIFILFVLFMPEGIWGLIQSRFKQKDRPDGAAGAGRSDQTLRRDRGRRSRDDADRGRRSARRHRPQRRRQNQPVPSDHRRRQSNRRPRSFRRIRTSPRCPRMCAANAACREPFSSRRCSRRCRRATTRVSRRRRGTRNGGCHWAAAAVFHDAARHGDAALERLGLTHVADRPAGLLSHGDQRLLEVAMALAQQPRLLLLDEPTQGLSVEETAQAVEVLAALFASGGLTVLLVEHDMEVVFRLAHKITVLHRGSVIADGDPDTVKADEGVQNAYLGGFA